MESQTKIETQPRPSRPRKTLRFFEEKSKKAGLPVCPECKRPLTRVLRVCPLDLTPEGGRIQVADTELLCAECGADVSSALSR